MQTTHCQICGRDIKSALGLIAHHGYRRPGGSQTASCPGARRLPYEISRDALPPTIGEGELHLDKVREALVNLLANPPECFTGVFRGQPYTVARPADFDPHNQHGGGIPRSYAAHYARQCTPLLDDIRITEANLDYLRRRLADWRAPEGAAGRPPNFRPVAPYAWRLRWSS